MRKLLVIYLCLISCVAVASQDTAHIYTDTIRASELVGRSDDSYLLSILNMQAEEQARKADSLHQHRLATELTTLQPFTIGYGDSIRLAKEKEQTGGASLLTLPLLYIPEEVRPLRQMAYTARRDTTPRLFREWTAVEPTVSARRYLNAHGAGLYVGTYDSTKLKPVREESVKSVYELEVAQKSLIKDAELDRQEKLNALKNQRNPWFKEMNLMLQFTQNYVSSNWFEGGNSSFAMYASAKGIIKYDDKKRITWDNLLEWNAGFGTTSGDTVHKINTNEDLFRIYSKLGVKVVDKLFGSLEVDYRSQVFPSFKSNSTDIKTGFCTPIRFNVALGLDYKPVKNLSVVVAPATYKLVFARDTINATASSFGIKEGRVLSDIGSSVRLVYVWKPLREIALETKFYMYTNYKMVELDMELNCDFIINRFMTARVRLRPRYDSSLIVEGDKRAKMQFKELISIGFAHKFH